MSDIALSPAEIFQGAMMGVMRRVRNMKAGRVELYSPPVSGAWDRHIEGALSELALAKHLNVFIADHTDRKCPDVGEVDCRATAHKNGRLIVHKNDPDERVFYLLVGYHGNYSVKGWIKGEDAKQDQWWTSPTGQRPPAYFVPQSALNQ